MESSSGLSSWLRLYADSASSRAFMASGDTWGIVGAEVAPGADSCVSGATGGAVGLTAGATCGTTGLAGPVGAETVDWGAPVAVIGATFGRIGGDAYFGPVGVLIFGDIGV